MSTGMVHITWSSLNVGIFLRRVEEAIAQFVIFTKQVHYVHVNETTKENTTFSELMYGSFNLILTRELTHCKDSSVRAAGIFIMPNYNEREVHSTVNHIVWELGYNNNCTDRRINDSYGYV